MTPHRGSAYAPDGVRIGAHHSGVGRADPLDDLRAACSAPVDDLIDQGAPHTRAAVPLGDEEGCDVGRERLVVVQPDTDEAESGAAYPHRIRPDGHGRSTAAARTGLTEQPEKDRPTRAAASPRSRAGAR
jgi:hypothetical protein